MDIVPELPAGNTPVDRIRRLMAGAKDRREVVHWGNESIPLRISLTELAVSGPDGLEWKNTFTLHTEELSRIGAPVLTLSLGVWRTPGVRTQQPDWDNMSIKVSCIAANDERHGNNLVALLKALARWLGAARIMLVDASFVSCPTGEPYDLAIFMIMRSGRTWYQQQGFKPMLAGSFQPENTQEAERRLEKLSADLKKVTVRMVQEDAERALKAVEWIIQTKEFDTLRLREPRLWKRDGTVEKNSLHFEMDLVRTVYELRGHFIALLTNMVVAKFRPAQSFAEAMVALQRSNCSLFADTYLRLFDNEVYNWRQTICPFNFEITRGPRRGTYHQRILQPVLALARLVGGGEKISAWMVWEVQKDAR